MNKTPLFSLHNASNAKMVEFAGWALPVQFRNIIEEHNTVRKGAGIFDIGHMGLIQTEDIDAVQSLTTNDLSRLGKGSAQYSMMCTETGGIVDDLIIYRIDDGVLVVANGINAQTVFQKIKAKSPKARLLYDKKTTLALQGPASAAMLQNMTAFDISKVKHRNIFEIEVNGTKALVSRSGYSGEDGFEFFVDIAGAQKIWKDLVNSGAGPCGLGARDTLRIEAALPLYGHELDLETTPIEAGFSKFVSMEKGGFTGRAAIEKQLAEGVGKILFGFYSEGRNIPRQGYRILMDGKEAGYVTSGTLSPTLGRPVGMGYLIMPSKVKPGDSPEIGELAVEIRGVSYPISIAELPFYKRKKI